MPVVLIPRSTFRIEIDSHLGGDLDTSAISGATGARQFSGSVAPKPAPEVTSPPTVPGLFWSWNVFSVDSSALRAAFTLRLEEMTRCESSARHRPWPFRCTPAPSRPWP